MKFSYKCVCEKGNKGFTVDFELKRCPFCNKETLKKGRQKRNKYGNVWTRCKQNHNHQSKGEAQYCDTLHLVRSKLGIESIETQKNFRLYNLDGKWVVHRVDFFVTYKSGKQEIHEFKGKELADWKLKRDMLKMKWPEIEYKVVR